MPSDPKYLERFHALRARHPDGDNLIHQFLGWFCGSGNAERLNPAVPARTVADELERFFAVYEAEIPKPEIA
jgi:hypothetical protein